MKAVIERVARAVETRRYHLLNQRRRDIACKGGLVSFTCDDFPESALAGANMLEERQWRGTFYLSTGLAGQDSNVGRIASIDMARSLHARGHEIGNHTDSHLRCQRAQKSVLRRELETSRCALAGIDGNRSFAFPFGAYDATSLNVLGGRFDTIRTVKHGVNVGLTDLNLLKANPVYETTPDGNIEALLDEAARRDGWLVFYTHDVVWQPSEFGCTPDKFAHVLSLVAQRGLRVRTMADAFASL